MTYTIQSARYATADKTAAFLETEEMAEVIATEADTPELWAAMLAWGKPSAYVAPAPAVPPLKAEWDSASTQSAKLAVLAKAMGLAG